ncbi:MAG: NRDE family protein, partial [Cyclobacteriaceae bacterium]
MCLIFISIDNHPKYKLVVAANRDEFYKRRTAPASFWEDHPEVVGGRDLEAQGTWMAMTTSGRVGMVTNYRDLSNIDPEAPSRGKLVTDYLFNGSHPDAYLKELHESAHEYNGFNLVIGNHEELYYYSNYQSKIVRLSSGFYGLSNHLLDTPWPKVQLGKEKVKAILDQKAIKTNDIFELLRDERTAPD